MPLQKITGGILRKEALWKQRWREKKYPHTFQKEKRRRNKWISEQAVTIACESQQMTASIKNWIKYCKEQEEKLLQLSFKI